MLSCNIKKKTQKRFPCSSFACWELSHVNSFSRLCFSLLFACSRKPKTPKIFQCVSLNFFSFILVASRRRPRWKCWVALIWITVELIKSLFYLVFSCWIKCFADSSLVHDTLALLLFSYHSVVQVKGNNDNIRWTGRGKEKLVWTRLVLFV